MHGDFTVEGARLTSVRSWCLITVVLLALTACTPKPPPYQSPVISPPSSSSQSAKPGQPAPDPQTDEASFIDEFNRPDTASGLGNGWDLRTPQRNETSFRPATDGYITDGHFTYAGKSDVIAMREFRAPLLSVGAEGQFSRRSSISADTTMMIGTAGDSNFETNVVIFAASRTDWVLQSKSAYGRLKTVVAGQFSHPLDLDREYQFVLSCTSNQAHVTGPGLDTTRPLPMPISPGKFGFWREYPHRPPVGGVFDFKRVWALEDGLPATPVETRTDSTAH